jgi:hypothetical protein
LQIDTDVCGSYDITAECQSALSHAAEANRILSLLVIV